MLVVLLVLAAPLPAALGDIFQWEYVNNNPLLQKQQSTMPCPDGAGVNGDLTKAWLVGADLTGAFAIGSNLTNADLDAAFLKNVNMSGAAITGADLNHTADSLRGFTKEQLYSTASYQANDLHDVALGFSALSGWDFHGQNLRNAYLLGSKLGNASFSGANLSKANLEQATLTNADLSGSAVTGASFRQTTVSGFTKDQLYSTASYQAKTLAGMDLAFNDLGGWNFRGQDLSNASLDGSVLTNTDLTGAVIRQAILSGATINGFTKEQLYSTASYRAKDLTGVWLRDNDLGGWQFDGQNVTNAQFIGSTERQFHRCGGERG